MPGGRRIHRPSHRAAVCGAWIWLVAGLPGRANGAEPGSEALPVRLQWEAPPPCPDQTRVRAEIDRLLTGASRDASDPIEATAKVSPVDGGWSLTLDLAAAGGHAQTTAASEKCEVLAELVALKIALTFDPIAVMRNKNAPEPPPEAPASPAANPPDDATAPPKEDTPTVEVEASPTPKPPAAKTDPAARATRQPAPRHLGLGARVSGGAAYGHLPGASFPLDARLALLLPRWRFEFGATYWFERPARYESDPNAGGDIRLLTGSFDACPTFFVESLELPVCVGVEAGAMHGRGVGLPEPASARRLWIAARVTPGIIWRFHPVVGLAGSVSGVFPFARPGFSADDREDVHRAAPAAVYGLVGLDLAFR